LVYIAAWADEIGGEQLLMRRVYNEPIVVFRDTTGRAAALVLLRAVKFTRWMKNSLPPPTYVKAAGFTGRVDRWQEFEYVAPGSVLQWAGAADANTGAHAYAADDGEADRRRSRAPPLPPNHATSCANLAGSNEDNLQLPQCRKYLLFRNYASLKSRRHRGTGTSAIASANPIRPRRHSCASRKR
jgi:hypothetical protein